MAYRTFIFDLDGTLLDTLSDLAASVNYALQQYDMPQHSIDDIRRFVGNGVRKLMERAVPDGTANAQFEAAFAAFRQHYMAHSLDTTRPYDGIAETLAELQRRGCRLAVVSNKMMAATRELVNHFFPDIEVAIGEHEAEGIRKNRHPIQCMKHCDSWVSVKNRRSMWATVMSTWLPPLMPVCLASVCYGDSATAPSS